MDNQKIQGIDRGSVTAIVVAQGRDFPYLAQTLAALAAQQLPVDHVLIGIETDADLPFLRRALPDARVHVIGEQPSFGAAVKTLRAMADDRDSWLWLLHADSAPEPDALDAMLRMGESSHSIGAVGPKHVGWDREPRTLVSVGIRATRSARRVPEVEPGELDQGQLDSRTDVLAVGTAGMLVRSEAWEELGGFDPFLGPFGDGLEFSRRLRLAGYRVVVEPRARIWHARVSLGERMVESFAMRRVSQAYNALLAAPCVLVPLLWLGFVLGGIVRAIARFFIHEPGYAGAEVRAGWKIAGALAHVARGRAQIRRVRKVPRRALSALEEKPWSVRLAQRQTRKAHQDARLMADVPDHLTLKELQENARANRWGRALVGAVSLAWMGLFLIPVASGGVLVGRHLAPGTVEGPDLFAAVLRGWIESGDGYPGAIDALWVFLSLPLLVLSPFQVTLGHLVTLLLWLAFPLAVLLAYAALGKIVISWYVRAGLAMVWVSAPAFVDSVATGRISGVVAFLGLTGCVYALGGAWRGGRHDLGVLAFFAMVASLGAPVFGVVALVVGVVGFVYHRVQVRWLLVALPALAVHIPGFRFAGIGYLLTSPGASESGVRDPREILSLVPFDDFSLSFPTLLAFMLPACLALVALLGLFQVRFYARARVAWLFAVAGLAIALFVVPLWPGYGQELVWVSLTTAVACGFAGTRKRLRAASFGVYHLVVGLIVVALGLSWIGSAGYTIMNHSKIRDVRPVQSSLIPAVGREDQRSGLKVLALEPHADGVTAYLWRGYGTELHELTMVAQAVEVDPAARDVLAQTVANVTGRAPDVARDLAVHGVSLIVVPPSNDPRRNELVGALNALPHVTYVSGHESGDFWRVEWDDSATLRVIPGHGRQISPASSERKIVIPERKDPHWHAQVGDTVLKSDKQSGWAQGFILPADAHGTVHITYRDGIHRTLSTITYAIMVLSLLFALPVNRRRLSR